MRLLSGEGGHVGRVCRPGEGGVRRALEEDEAAELLQYAMHGRCQQKDFFGQHVIVGHRVPRLRIWHAMMEVVLFVAQSTSSAAK